jgi:transposase
MKYTPEERMDIGRRIYNGELSCRIAAEIYGINKHTAKRYLWLYRDTLGLPPKVGRPESLSRAVAKMTSSSSGEMTDYESMTREELIQELVLAKIHEARAKKGYEVKGVGVEKEYIVYDSKNTK